MSSDELEREIAASAAFWGYERDGALVGVMGIQPVRDVHLIRHAYVRPDSQRQGLGGALLKHLSLEHRHVTKCQGRGRPPQGERALTSAERQARYRQRKVKTG